MRTAVLKYSSFSTKFILNFRNITGSSSISFFACSLYLLLPTIIQTVFVRWYWSPFCFIRPDNFWLPALREFTSWASLQMSSWYANGWSHSWSHLGSQKLGSPAPGQHLPHSPVPLLRSLGPLFPPLELLLSALPALLHLWPFFRSVWTSTDMLSYLHWLRSMLSLLA